MADQKSTTTQLERIAEQAAYKCADLTCATPREYDQELGRRDVLTAPMRVAMIPIIRAAMEQAVESASLAAIIAEREACADIADDAREDE